MQGRRFEEGSVQGGRVAGGSRSPRLAISRTGRRIACLTVLVGILLGCVLSQAAGATESRATVRSRGLGRTIPSPSAEGLSPEATPAQSKSAKESLTPSTTRPYKLCQPAGRRKGKGTAKSSVECDLIVDPHPVRKSSRYALPAGGPLLEGSGEDGGYDPKDLQEAYKIPTSGGESQTVAIVDVYGDETAESDLAKYREKYGLEPCTKSNGCFSRVNEKGEEANYAKGGKEEAEEWAMETSLDMDMVSAACAKCHILVVEASSASISSLAASVEEAAKLKATEISNSYGAPETVGECGENGCSKYLSAYNHPGIPVTVSSGDWGYDYFLAGYDSPGFPATSPNVIAVGGTELKKAENARGWSEAAWDEASSRGLASGSGCSLFQSKPAWQSDTGCAKRTDNDVAADAACATPVSVYSTLYLGGWGNICGTSASAPLVAGIEAHASSAVRAEGAEAFYKHSLFDVTSGSDDPSCKSTNYLCAAGAGYDGPTGWGTPDGTPELAPGFRAVTAPATSINGGAITLAGYVYPEEKETTYRFEYGPTTSYGATVPTPEASVGSGALWKAASQSVTVAPGTYHYRLVATNSSGTVYGNDQAVTAVPWALQKAADPTGSKVGVGELRGVSCSSSSACMAVGYTEEEYGREESELGELVIYTQLPFAERWNGTEWLTQTPENSGEAQTPSKRDRLVGVSCSSSSACTAVGFYVNTASKEVTLAERWDGTKWKIQTTLNPTGSGSELDAVSCPSSSECTAVGYYVSSGKKVPFAERWNGTAWESQSMLLSSEVAEDGALLDGVSCSSSKACTAVGSFAASSFAESWNGTKWEPESLAKPTGDPELRAVSCTSSNACTAVGGTWSFGPEGGTEAPLAERWNGTEWTIESTPTPTGAQLTRLEGVSCATSIQCIAVGTAEQGKGSEAEDTAVSERWNGTEWAIEGTAPDPNVDRAWGEAEFLEGVSCSSFNDCTAVGSYGEYRYPLGGRTVPLAERWALPVAETEPASNVTPTEATLKGTVNPDGVDTHYQFEYGTTTSYGHSVPVPSEDVGAGTANVKVSKTLSGLVRGIEYHFRVVATNGTDVAYGADRTFTTPSLLHWSACKKASGGVYKNNTCNEAGAPNEYEWAQLATATRSKTVSSGGKFVLTSTVAGSGVKIECNKEEGTGWIENPTGGGAGTGLFEAKFKECSVPAPTGQHCKVKEPIEFKASTELVNQEGLIEEKLTPSGGSNFGTVTFEGCANSALNKSYNVGGTEYGILTGSSSVKFTPATSSKLAFAGEEATLEGTSKQEIEGGGATGVVLHWSECKKQTGGKYKSNACNEAGAPNEYEWAQLATATRSKTVSSGGKFVLTSTVAGSGVKIECNKEEGTGWIENPTGGGAGTGLFEAKFKECSVPAPTGQHCKVKEPIEFKASTELVNQEGLIEEKLTPSGGSNFGTVTFEGCANSALNKSYNVGGTEYGILTGSSSVKFTPATSSKLAFAGEEATLEGTSKQEIEGGGATLVA
jgi:hypothetical protein